MPWLSLLSHVFSHDERCLACGADGCSTRSSVPGGCGETCWRWAGLACGMARHSEWCALQIGPREPVHPSRSSRSVATKLLPVARIKPAGGLAQAEQRSIEGPARDGGRAGTPLSDEHGSIRQGWQEPSVHGGVGLAAWCAAVPDYLPLLVVQDRYFSIGDPQSVAASRFRSVLLLLDQSVR